MNKNLDAGGSPRSVLEPKALYGIEKVDSQEKQARSLRSPRSGLESLLSSPRCSWDKKGSEGIGLGIVAAIYAEETYSAKFWANEAPKENADLSTQAVPLKCSTVCSPTLSKPIPIFQNNVLPTCRGMQENRAIKVDHETLNDSSRCHQGRRNQPRSFRSDVDVDVDDEESDIRESIFSTASPASSCNDNWGGLPAIDFLHSCYFCKRLLALGKDIYMYRGDRAFCSAECRYQQIVIDEHKERSSAAAFSGKAVVAPGASNHRSRVLVTTTAAAA